MRRRSASGARALALGALLALGTGGCVHLPAEVAAELRAPAPGEADAYRARVEPAPEVEAPDASR
jgi:hypothetical protein